MASFLKLNSGDYLLQTDGIGKILLAYSFGGLTAIARFFSTHRKPIFFSLLRKVKFYSHR